MVGYSTLKEVRRAIGSLPKYSRGISLGTGNNANKDFYITEGFLVDGNGDELVDIEDITVYVTASEVTVSSIDVDKKKVTLSAAPGTDAAVTADYFWSPIPDSEILPEIENFSSIIEGRTNQKYGRDNEKTQYWDGDGKNNRFYFDHVPMYSLDSYEIDSVTSGLTENTDYWLYPDNLNAQWIEFLTSPLPDRKNIKIVYK